MVSRVFVFFFFLLRRGGAGPQGERVVRGEINVTWVCRILQKKVKKNKTPYILVPKKNVVFKWCLGESFDENEFFFFFGLEKIFFLLI